MLLHLLGGSHNDALMLGFLALGFAAFLRDKRWLAVVLVAFATGVKLTAAPALVFMAWNWQDDPTITFARRVRTSAVVVAAAAAVIAALSVVVGVGPGWMAALRSTGQSMLDLLAAHQGRLRRHRHPAVGRAAPRRPRR